MNGVTAMEKLALLAHYTKQAALAKRRPRIALVSIAGQVECEASYSLQGGSVYLDEISFDTVNWCDATEWMLPSKIALIEADIEESIREAGQ